MATLQQQLDEALQARHQLLVGKSMVSFGHGQRRMEFTAANLKELDTYIAGLRRQLAGLPVRRGRISYMVPH